MPKALVCITTNLDANDEVLHQLRACEGVEEAYKVQGVYDIVAQIQGTDLDALKKVLTDRVMATKNVNKTLTLIVMDK